MKHFYLLICMMVLLLAFTGCDANVSTSPGAGNSGYSNGSGSSNSDSGFTSTKNGGSSSGPAGQGKTTIGTRTKTSGCKAQGGYQDFACSPGAIIPDATKDKICVSGYSSSVRNVPTSEKNQVYAEYGITSHTTGEYEVDHIISLELGGSNEIANLYPEAALPKPGFHEKDKVENYLHSQVCSGAIALHDAQVKIANSWLDVYNQMPKK